MPVLKSSTTSTSNQACADRKILVPSRIQCSVHGGLPTRLDLFSDFLDQMDPHAGRSNISNKPLNPIVRRCQDEDHRSANIRHSWTRDSSDRAGSFDREERTLHHSDPRLLLSSRSSKYQDSPLNVRPWTTTDNGTDSTLAITCTCIYPSGSRK